MNMKEQLIKLKWQLESKKTISKMYENYMFHKMTGNMIADPTVKSAKIIREYNNFHLTEMISLDDKVEEFIKWYLENLVNGFYTKSGECRKSIEIRNFIEKMAEWYELRFPDDKVNSELVSGKVKNEVEVLDWKKFYKTLSSSEKSFLAFPKYQKQIGIDISGARYYYSLTPTGYVRTLGGEKKIPIIDKKGKMFEFEDVHIETLLAFLRNGDFDLYQPHLQYIENMIQRYKKDCYVREEVLNCVMYRIIERGGNRIGPRRAFLFAKTFDRNIDIPMAYGVDCSDPDLGLFINEYIKAGGSKDLVCYIDYFDRSSTYERNIITVGELLSTYHYNGVTFYTSDELELYQKLVNVLKEQVNLGWQKVKK